MKLALRLNIEADSAEARLFLFAAEHAFELHHVEAEVQREVQAIARHLRTNNSFSCSYAAMETLLISFDLMVSFWEASGTGKLGERPEQRDPQDEADALACRPLIAKLRALRGYFFTADIAARAP